MADFEGIIKQHVGEDGNIPQMAIATIVTAIKQAVGNEFVDKERYKAKLSEIDTLKEKQQTAEDDAATAEKWKEKFDKLKDEFGKYKADQEAAADSAKRTNAYRNLLKEAGVSEKRIDAVLKVSDISSVKLDDSGKIEDSEKLTEKIKDEWADFIETKGSQGAETPNPPTNNGGDVKTPSRAALLAAKYKEDHYGSKEG